MKFRDMFLATATSVIWGAGFVVARFGLDDFSPAELTALRFSIICPLVVFFPRPKVPGSMIVAIGSTLFAGQFLLLYFSFAVGMPPGLASVTQQMQAFFTVLLAAAFFGERPTLFQIAGMAVAFCGLVFIGSTIGYDLPPLALGLALGAAFSWSVGNVLVKNQPFEPILPLMVWCSLVPSVPAIVVSYFVDGGNHAVDKLLTVSWSSWAVVIYLGLFAGLLAYAMWGSLLQRYSASAIAPFALLSPCVGTLLSALVLGERFSFTRYTGMALIIVGLVINIASAGRGPKKMIGSARSNL